MFWLPNMCVSESTTEATETRVLEKSDTTIFTPISEDLFSETRGYDEISVSADGNPSFCVCKDIMQVKTDCNKSVIEAGAFSEFPNNERIVRLNQYDSYEYLPLGDIHIITGDTICNTVISIRLAVYS